MSEEDVMQNLHLSFLRWWGYDIFRRNQLEAMMNILKGRDTFVCAATGSGKSVIFQLPAVALRDSGCKATTLVVSPLISLIDDQIASLRALGVAVGCIGGNADPMDEERAINGDFAVLYCTPEKLLIWSHGLQRLLESTRLVCLAIDESHCVSEWGHDFRPSYRRLGDIRSEFKIDAPILALTATATTAVETDIISNLRLKTPLMLRTTFNRPNLKYSVRQRTSVNDLLRVLLEYKSIQTSEVVVGEIGSNLNRPYPSTLVYVNTKRDAEELVSLIRQSTSLTGVASAFYHAGMSSTDRQNVHTSFSRDMLQIVVATVAFGMGIHKPDIRLIVHYGMPKSVESYYQQTGRAGRDGLAAYCVLLYNRQDMTRCFQIAASSTGNATTAADERLVKQIREINNYAIESTRCRREMLLAYFNEGNITSSSSSPSSHSPTEKSGGASVTAETGTGSNSTVSLDLSTTREKRPTNRNCCDNCDQRGRTERASRPAVGGVIEAGRDRGPSNSLDLGKEVFLLVRTVRDCGEFFGINVVLGVLMGSRDKSVQRIRGYDDLRTFGLGSGHVKEWWRALAQQLVDTDDGFLAAVMTRSSGFAYERFIVAPKGQELLNAHAAATRALDVRRAFSKSIHTGAARDACAAACAATAPADPPDVATALSAIKVMLQPSADLRRLIAVEKSHGTSFGRRAISLTSATAATRPVEAKVETTGVGEDEEEEGQDGHIEELRKQEALLAELFKVRNTVAQRHGTSPYNILASADLQAMALRLPRDEAALAGMPGWGCWKVKAFGKDFCEAICRMMQTLGMLKDRNAGLRSAEAVIGMGEAELRVLEQGCSVNGASHVPAKCQLPPGSRGLTRASTMSLYKPRYACAAGNISALTTAVAPMAAATTSTTINTAAPIAAMAVAAAATVTNCVQQAQTQNTVGMTIPEARQGAQGGQSTAVKSSGATSICNSRGTTDPSSVIGQQAVEPVMAAPLSSRGLVRALTMPTAQTHIMIKPQFAASISTRDEVLASEAGAIIIDDDVPACGVNEVDNDGIISSMVDTSVESEPSLGPKKISKKRPNDFMGFGVRSVKMGVRLK